VTAAEATAAVRAAIAAAAPAEPAAPARYRMRDLCELTGLSRQAIHFYIQQGLVPEGAKTGRNMAWYGPAHVERLRLIRRLQEERYLPLKAIRALFAGETADLAPAQRALLAEVGARLDGTIGAGARPEMVDAAAACARAGVQLDELRRMAAHGLVAVRDDGGALEVSSDAVWLLELWGQLRAAGFTAERGFDVPELQIYEEAVTGLFQREVEIAAGRLERIPAEDAAAMLERGLPILHAIFVYFHTAAVRNFFAALGAAPAAPPPPRPEEEPHV
jgi:DNA-binding transcriptional MerR regulator